LLSGVFQLFFCPIVFTLFCLHSHLPINNHGCEEKNVFVKIY
jgi:hypothetical protein